MSRKTNSSPSLRSLKNKCDEIILTSGEHILLATAPNPESTLATSLLCRAIMKSGGTFHVSFEEPILQLDTINAIRTEHESTTIVFVGIETLGKKKLRKGKSYPIFIGGTSESEQVISHTLGNAQTIPAAAYVLAKEHLIVGDYELQMAAAATLIYDKSYKSPKKPSPASKSIIKQAFEENLLEERGGIKLFGFSFLPLDEVLLFSTRPYIQGISGNQKGCDTFLNEADVPITKLRNPLSLFSNSEIQHFTQHLTSRLLEKTGPSIIPLTFGTDYILTRENESSPLRYLSGIEAIADTVWARQELGASMSIWIGDRGRALRTMIDTYLNHNRDVISTILRLENKTKAVSSETGTSIELPGVRSELLTDIGRVVLQNELVNTNRPLAISNEESSVITWTFKNIDLNQIMRIIQQKNVNPLTTSERSLKFEGMTPAQITEIFKIIKDRRKKKG